MINENINVVSFREEEKSIINSYLSHFDEHSTEDILFLQEPNERTKKIVKEAMIRYNSSRKVM